MQQTHLSVSFLQRCREIYYTLRDLLHEIGLCIIGPGSVHFSFVQLLSRVRLFVTSWTAAHQGSLSITSSWSLTKLMSTELVIPFNHLILCCPFSSRLQSFPASGSFQMSQSVDHIMWSKYWSFSFSISPSNEYSRLISFKIDFFDWF